MADVRLTRQFVEVMAPVPTSGLDIRLTRQFVEVMVPVPTSGLDVRMTRQFVEVMLPNNRNPIAPGGGGGGGTMFLDYNDRGELRFYP
jgi:hypothetical protein